VWQGHRPRVSGASLHLRLRAAPRMVVVTIGFECGDWADGQSNDDRRVERFLHDESAFD
jgi:hypothetical protein